MTQSMSNGRQITIVKINHTGRAGSMKTASLLKIFEWLFVTHGLKCTRMLGDGDSSTYSAIVDSQPHGEDCIPIKLKCIGHVEKHVRSWFEPTSNFLRLGSNNSNHVD